MSNGFLVDLKKSHKQLDSPSYTFCIPVLLSLHCKRGDSWQHGTFLTGLPQLLSRHIGQCHEICPLQTEGHLWTAATQKIKLQRAKPGQGLAGIDHENPLCESH